MGEMKNNTFLVKQAPILSENYDATNKAASLLI